MAEKSSLGAGSRGRNTGAASRAERGDGAASMDPLVMKLARLRGFKGGRDRDLTLSAPMRVQLVETRRQRKQLGGAGAAWVSVVPEGMAAGCVLEKLERGTLLVKACDSAARYEVDRFLRSGGLEALVQASRGMVRRVRVVV